METTEQVTIVSTEEVAALNAARTALIAIAGRARYEHASQNSGVLYEVATQAEGSLFRVLNISHVYMGAALSDDQIHNRP